MSKIYTVRITRTTDVDVFADSWQEAKESVKEMYLSGDCTAELDDAVYSVVRISNEETCDDC